MPKLVVALFYARFDVVVAVSRPETACKAFPARSAGSMQ